MASPQRILRGPNDGGRASARLRTGLPTGRRFDGLGYPTCRVDRPGLQDRRSFDVADLHHLDDPIEGSSVLVVEDIIDTGLTLNYLLKILRQRDPASIEVAVLLDKDVRRIVELPIAYRGFSIPDRFVVGYGLDHRSTLRNLPYVVFISARP